MKILKALILGLGLLSASSQAALITNSNFDAAGTVTGDIISDVDQLTANTWILGGNDNQDSWTIVNNVAINSATGSEAQGLLQWFNDSRASTGVGVLDFSLMFNKGNGRLDLALYLFGWMTGDTSPKVDLENGDLTAADSFTPGGSSSLIGNGYSLDSEGKLTFLNNGVPTIAGLVGGIQQTISVNIDFGAGYDNIGVYFYGENSGGILEIDSVTLTEVSAPASLGLLGFGLLACLISRRKTSKK